jgi:hypothetical protein
MSNAMERCGSSLGIFRGQCRAVSASQTLFPETSWLVNGDTALVSAMSTDNAGLQANSVVSDSDHHPGQKMERARSTSG